MGSISSPPTIISPQPLKQSPAVAVNRVHWTTQTRIGNAKKSPLTVVAAIGDVTADGTPYLIGGAAAVALLGTAFPILFSRKDLCPVCDGAGFVRKSEVTLRANAARKDEKQIVCANCNGLGKLNQIDKK